MSGIAREDVEILVHVTAPSCGLDDTRYRALAEAYLNFEPIVRQRLGCESSRDIVETGWARNINSQCREEGQGTKEERESAASYRPEDEEDNTNTTSGSSVRLPLSSNHSGPTKFTYSPELSFNSVIDNADSPRFEWLAKPPMDDRLELPGQSGVLGSLSSWQSQSSVVANSQPDNEPSLAVYSSPVRVLELYLKQMERGEGPSFVFTSSREEIQGRSSTVVNSSPQQQEQVLPNDICIVNSSPLLNRGLRFQPRQDHRSRSPDAPSTEYINIGLKRKRADSEDIHIPSSAPSQIFSPVLMPSIPISSPKCQRTAPKEPTTQNDLLSSGKFTEINISRCSLRSTTAPSNWSGLLEIRSSPPATSVCDLTAEMLITCHLHKLTERMPPEKYFRPQEQMREVRPMERGHWSVNCQTWGEKLTSRAWNCLGEFIGKDSAGWGVWCMRDSGHTNIRVYCWGIIIPNIYLLLYIASERKIMGTGACWIAGDRKAVIKML